MVWPLPASASPTCCIYLVQASCPPLILKPGLSNPQITPWYGVLQFDQIPNKDRRSQLKIAGVQFHHFLRESAWYVSLPVGFDRSHLVGQGIRAAVEMQAHHKLSPELRSGQVPEYAKIGEGRIRLNVMGVPVSAEWERTHPGWQVEGQYPEAGYLVINLPEGDLQILAAMTWVFYLEAIDPPMELEQQVNRTNHRSNFIAADYTGGLAYDGTGVTAAVSEGMVDTTQIDFHGRIDPSYHGATSFSGHATGVCRRMAGAGNQNPLDKGMAYGADLLTIPGGAWNNNVYYGQEGLRVANHSYGYGCQGGYNTASATIDLQVRTQSGMMHVFSCGNIGGDSSCAWYGAPGWATINGAVKSAKNVIATGALNKYDQRMGFSSKGPAYDGRIKPDLCAVGPGGTSHAAPGVAGVYTQLFQAFKALNSGTEPESGMLKVILQNTAEDLGNSGPDFEFGYGRINARRAYETIRDQRWLIDSVGQAAPIPLLCPQVPGKHASWFIGPMWKRLREPPAL